MGGGPLIKPKQCVSKEAAHLGEMLLEHCSTESTESISMAEVKRLVEKGADIDWHDGVGFTPLSWLIFYDHIDGVRYLLKQGVSLTHPEKSLFAKDFEEDAKKKPVILKMIRDEKKRRKDIAFQKNREKICENVDKLKNDVPRKRLHLKKFRAMNR